MKVAGYIVFMIAMLGALSCDDGQVGQNFLSRNVVIIVVDGPRLSETWEDPAHVLIPNQYALRSEGVFFSNFQNNGTTRTVPGHVAMTTGVYQSINNSGGQYPQNPSIFQYWRKRYKKDASKAWVIASKDKLEVLSDCEGSSWDGKFRPYTDCGINGLGTGYRDDSVTVVNAMNIFDQYHPEMVLINLKEPDVSGHSGVWDDYLQGIVDTDQQVQQLVDFLNTHPVYKGKTAIFITNDHGRHLDGVLDGFKSHGDDCSGCRRISLLAIGPDFPKDVTVNTLYEQTDMARTIGRLMHFSVNAGDGQVMKELFE